MCSRAQEPAPRSPSAWIPNLGRELVTLMLVSESVLVAALVTTTCHQTSEPYTVADGAQSAALPGSQEDPTGNVHTCTTAEMESVAADAGVGVHASMANRGSKSPAARDSRTRGTEFRLMVIPFLLTDPRRKLNCARLRRNPGFSQQSPHVWVARPLRRSPQLPAVAPCLALCPCGPPFVVVLALSARRTTDSGVHHFGFAVVNGHARRTAASERRVCLRVARDGRGSTRPGAGLARRAGPRRGRHT